MASFSWLGKLTTAPKSSFCILDEKKSKRMGGAATLYIPSVDDVADAIRAIPRCQTRTIVELRATLAKIGNAQVAFPAKTLKFWKWMANLPEVIKVDYPPYDILWWRILKNGKRSRHMPGGIENQTLLLKSESKIISYALTKFFLLDQLGPKSIVLFDGAVCS